MTMTTVLGAMFFGTRTDEPSSMRLLDRFVERGGSWIDTANCYAFWADPSGVGGQSEQLLGRWLASRPGMRERVRIATKVRQQPTVPHRWPESAEYTRADKPFPEAYEHPGTVRRLAALDEVAGQLGATRNQVVLAWMRTGTPTVAPIVGVSTVEQLDEALDAEALTLSAEQRELLDTAA